MTQQTHLPVLALSLIAVMAASVLLIGSISYLMIDSNVGSTHNAIIPQVNTPGDVQPADLPQPDSILLSPEAVKTIVEAATGQTITHFELERVRGITVYEVKAGPYELYVDALTGEILYQKHDD